MRLTPRAAPFALVLLVGGVLSMRESPAARAEPRRPAAVVVRTTAELVAALRDATPGAVIRVAPGEYAGGISVAGPVGTEKAPISVTALDPERPPVIRGGGSGLQLSDPAFVELSDLAFVGQRGNGLNIDDGGTAESPAHHVTLRRISVTDVGPDGNCDGIKLSGLDDFRVDACTVVRWGRGGSAVDMVGCRRGLVEGCTFRHEGSTPGASGVQAKGGTCDVTIRRSRFEHAGSRAINAGGSTGLPYFRPALVAWKGPRFEAKDLTIEGNTILGADAAIAFVGIDGAVVRFNTIHLPGRWALRLLQETRETGFVPCRGGVVTDNLIVFRSDAWREGGVNVGSGTEPTSFRFARNVWFCVDAPARTRELVRLPVEENDGVHGKDPGLADPTKGDLRASPSGPAAKAGADALPR